MTAFATFETATIADAVRKASRIAPTKGASFDKAAGLVMEIEPGEPTIVLRATNIEVQYHERVNALEVGDDSRTWRFQSQLLADILGGLPLGSGSSVTLTENQNGWVNLKCGRRRAKLSQILGIYPTWDTFDPEKLDLAPGFASRVKQVAWACDKQTIPYTGVHVTGEHLIATDRYQIATVPLPCPVDRPITVPMDVLAPVLTSTVDVKLRATDRWLHIMPDDFTQIATIIYDAEYPPLERLRSIMREDFTGECELDRTRVIDTIQALLVLVRKERYPNCRITFSGGEINFYMNLRETGEIEDTIEVDYRGKDFVIDVTPEYLLNALGASDHKNVALQFGPDPHRPFKISDSSGYAAWIMPRKIEEGGTDGKD